jgi:hypothetical protein
MTEQEPDEITDAALATGEPNFIISITNYTRPGGIGPLISNIEQFEGHWLIYLKHKYDEMIAAGCNFGVMRDGFARYTPYVTIEDPSMEDVVFLDDLASTDGHGSLLESIEQLLLKFDLKQLAEWRATGGYKGMVRQS